MRILYNMQRRKFAVLFALLAGFFAYLPLVRACAVCFTGVDGSVADAYDWSVFFLMATPYLVVGSIAGSLMYTRRRTALKKVDQAAAQETPLELAWDHKESGR